MLLTGRNVRVGIIGKMSEIGEGRTHVSRVVVVILLEKMVGTVEDRWRLCLSKSRETLGRLSV